MQIANAARPSGNSVKMSADILKYFEESFLRCDTAGMVFSGLAADRLWNMRVKPRGALPAAKSCWQATLRDSGGTTSVALWKLYQIKWKFFQGTLKRINLPLSDPGRGQISPWKPIDCHPVPYNSVSPSIPDFYSNYRITTLVSTKIFWRCHLCFAMLLMDIRSFPILLFRDISLQSCIMLKYWFYQMVKSLC